ncbi:MAG: asparagine synthase (glutamine-hydrolyzing) [Pseudoalteromonas sp.]|nr:MAG: asparagine synthase (glutamine-hydrolyzing) [Pseudoalteromonas sp.]
MCGINGYQGKFSHGLIQQMNSSIVHRGPDNTGFISSGDTCLGHVRLSIIDLSPKSNQPMRSKNSNFEIVFNGEIYNFIELRKKLVNKGVHFNSNGDSEVLLELWSLYKEESLEMLNGIFSFAIFEYETGTLTVVRDHFGVKPLYYAETEKGFIFSSEVKAILQSSDVSRAINLNAVASVLELLWQPGTETVLKSVNKLPPGSMIQVKDGKIKEIKRYHTLPEYNGKYSLNESESELEKSLLVSVEEQLVADVEVGAFLSGGLDSSLLCAIAKKIRPSFVKTYSIKIDSDENKKEGLEDDLPFAKKVAKELGLELNIVDATSDLTSLLPKCIFHLDEPQADPAILNAFKICEGAKHDGIKVLLSGAGGDDLFTGYRRHYATKLDGLLDILPTYIKHALSNISKSLSSNNPTSRRIKKFFETLHLDSDDRLVSYFSWMSQKDVKNLFADEAREMLSKSFGSEILKTFIGNKNMNNIEKLLELEKEFFLVDHNFNYTDKMSMAHGVEVRVPFLSKYLIETASAIPTRYKQKGSEGKWILKRVAEKWLPKSVIYRKKTGFGAPLRSWVHGPLKPIILNVLSKKSIEARGIFKYSIVKEMIEKDLSGEKDYAYSIYSLLTLEIWFRQFIDFDKPKEISIEELIKS